MFYVARFSFDQQQKGNESETGSFEILIEAATAENAADACKPYLESVVRTQKRDAFAGEVVVFLDDLFELTLPLSKPALINFRVHRAAGFSEIINPVVDAAPEVTAYGWGDPDEAEEQEPFMTFKPAPRKARARGAKKPKPVPRSKSKRKPRQA